MKTATKTQFRAYIEWHEAFAALNGMHNYYTEEIPYFGTKDEILDIVIKATGCKKVLSTDERPSPSGSIRRIIYENARHDIVIITLCPDNADVGIFSRKPYVADRYNNVFKSISIDIKALYPDKHPVLAWCYLSPDISNDRIPVTINLVRNYESIIPLTNYVQHVSDHLKLLEEQLDTGSHAGRIILLEGPPGTGKSYYIRRLVYKLLCAGKYRDVHYFLGAGSKILNINHCLNNNLLIFEDADEILCGSRSSDTIYSKILNLSSGFLDMRSLFIFTSNLPTSNIDEAFTREGRLLSRTYFELFPRRNAEHWFEIRGMRRNLPNDRYSLAELYAILNGNSSVKHIMHSRNNTLGFRSA